MRTEATTDRASLAADELRRRRARAANAAEATGGGGAPGEDENPQRHAEGVDRERPPRPLGVAPGSAWEPRNPTRSVAGHTIT